MIISILRHYWKKGLSTKPAVIYDVEGAQDIHQNTVAIRFRHFNHVTTYIADESRSGCLLVVDKRCSS